MIFGAQIKKPKENWCVDPSVAICRMTNNCEMAVSLSLLVYSCKRSVYLRLISCSVTRNPMPPPIANLSICEDKVTFSKVREDLWSQSKCICSSAWDRLVSLNGMVVALGTSCLSVTLVA